jgi:FixJ family two-component response regulator
MQNSFLALVPASHQGSVARIAPGRALRIVVADDDGAVREMIARALLWMGHRAVVLPQQQAVLDYVRLHQCQIDCLVVDVPLTTNLGRETLKLVSELDRELPIVILSHAGPAEVRSAAALDPRTPVLRKPFALSDLNRAIMQATIRSSGPAAAVAAA